MLELDFRPFHLLPRWRNAHLAQPNSAFAALNQAKIIENRLASPKPDRLLSLPLRIALTNPFLEIPPTLSG